MDRVIEFRSASDARRWGRYGGVGLHLNTLYSQNVGALSYFAGVYGQSFIEVKERDRHSQSVVLTDEQVEAVWKDCGRVVDQATMPPGKDRPEVVVFTGTRKGMTAAQGEAVRTMLCYLDQPGAFYHGCAVGADYQFHQMVRWGNGHITGFPAAVSEEHTRVKDCKCHNLEEPAPPLQRNREMVDRAAHFHRSILIAAPASMTDTKTGTWATVRHAVVALMDCTVVAPDGTFHPQVGAVGKSLVAPGRRRAA